MDKCEDQKSEKYVCACMCARFLSKVIMKVFWLRRTWGGLEYSDVWGRTVRAEATSTKALIFSGNINGTVK